MSKVRTLVTAAVVVGLIADLLSPRRAHLPVCAHEAYWRKKVLKAERIPRGKL